MTYFQRRYATGLLCVACFFLVGVFNCVAAQSYRISGYVEDSESGDRIAGVHVYLDQQRAGATTNQHGFYSLNVSALGSRISASHVSYVSALIDVNLSADTVLVIRLDPRVVSMDEMAVTSEGESLARRIRMSQHRLPIQQLEEIPVLLGESDVLRTLQLLPGLQGGREGVSDIYVRGGGSDQNLILLDGQPVYNPTHILGIFSVFNSSTLRSVELIKGGFPARYGGRLSSVVNVTMKEGNRNRFAGEGALGILTSKLLIEGPLVRDKASFLFSGRRTFLDLLARLFQNNGRVYGGYFHDVNFKANYTFSSWNHVHVSGYWGEDALTYQQRTAKNPQTNSDSDGTYKWGNRLASVQWNRLIGDKVFANLIVGVTNYHVGREFEQRRNLSDGGAELYATSWRSSIVDLSTRLELEYAAGPRHYLRGGIEYIHHQLSPRSTQTQLKSDEQPQLNTETASGRQFSLHELAVHLEDEFQISTHVRSSVGLRVSSAHGDGKLWGALEPRMGVNIALKKNSSLKLSYALMKQYLHLITQLGGSSLTQHQWIPSMNGVPPQRSTQVAVGFAQGFPGYAIDISLEVYRKRTHGVTELKQYSHVHHASVSGWPALLEFGEGTSYGLEVLVQRQRQRLSGWVSYTLAKSSRKFPNLNGGKSFPDTYDRRHDISVVLNYQVSPRISLGASWVYGSGYPVWAPAGRYYSRFRGDSGEFEFLSHLDYGAINSSRAPSVHRLDVSIQLKKQRTWGKRTLVLGIYNIYNRQNPTIIYPEIKIARSKKIQWKQRSLLQLIPALSYQIEF